MTFHEKKIVYPTSLIHGLVHVQMLIFAVVNIEMAADLGTSVTGIGFIGTISYFLFGLGALPAGFIIDKIGARKVIVICVSGMAVGDALIAFGNSEMFVMAGLALLGLAGSLYHPAGLGLISRNVEQPGHALGIHGTFSNVAVAFGTLLTGFVASQFGWKAAYIWPIVPMIIFSVTYYFIRFGDVGEDNKHLNPNPSQKFEGNMFKIMILVILIQAISGFVYRASNTFLPAFTGKALADMVSGLDVLARGGLMASVILIFGALGQYLSGRLTRRFEMEKLQLLFALSVVPMLVLMATTSGPVLLISGMAFAFTFYGLQPLGNALVAKYSPPGMRGRSYGLSFFLNFGVGAFGSWFAGYVGDYYGFQNVYLSLAFVSVFSVAIAFLVWRFYFKAKADAAKSQASMPKQG